MRYQIRRVAVEDWQDFRDLRLEALRDSPAMFAETHREAADRAEAQWRALTATAALSPTTAIFAARDQAGSWVGMAGTAPIGVEVPDTAHVHGVFVTPGHRGADGPAEALMTATIAWARDHLDVGRLTLGVHEDNHRARAFYRRIGFTDSDKTLPCPHGGARRMIIMGYQDFRVVRPPAAV